MFAHDPTWVLLDEELEFVVGRGRGDGRVRPNGGLSFVCQGLALCRGLDDNAGRDRKRGRCAFGQREGEGRSVVVVRFDRLELEVSAPLKPSASTRVILSSFAYAPELVTTECGRQLGLVDYSSSCLSGSLALIRS